MLCDNPGNDDDKSAGWSADLEPASAEDGNGKSGDYRGGNALCRVYV